MENKRFRQPANALDEVVINTKAVVKVNKGGRIRRFQAIVVVGNKKGLVGLGTGKANEVAEAIKKARQEANKNLVQIPIVDQRTIPHQIIGIKGATRVILKPAVEGTGIIAGGAVRSVLEVAGIHDIISKSLGSRTKLNMARATIEGLTSLKTIDQVAAARGKTKEEILG